MKAVILAGGYGTRLSEETHLRPKPMIEIGGMPIIWHIMKMYSNYNINEFIICCGHKGYIIKEYFANYLLHNSDVTFHVYDQSRMEIHNCKSEPWTVTLVDTGEKTQTGGRLKRVRKYIDDDHFCFSYGDGVSDIDIQELINHHKGSDFDVTLTAVQPPGRFGALNLEGNRVIRFQEKPEGDNAWISGGFFVVNTHIIDLIDSDYCSWEAELLPKLAKSNCINAYFHKGFWQPMDTLRDKIKLEDLWNSGNAPWKSW